MSGRLSTVLLDMGGVLLPEIGSFEGATRQPDLQTDLRAAGIAEPVAFVSMHGQRLSEAYRAHGPTHTQPDPEQVLADLDSDVRAILLRGLAREETQPFFPWARDLVEGLSRRFRLGLVSNTIVPGDHHARAFEAAGLLHHFGAVVWSANFGIRKPSPVIVDHVLAKLGSEPDEAALVGDKIRTDVAAARAAGVRSIWLRRGDAPDTGEAAPDFTVHGADEIVPLVESLAR